MSKLLWSGLNVVIVLGLLYVFFRAVILVKQYLGTGAACAFIAGLLLVGCRPGGALPPTINLLATKAPAAPLGIASAHYSVPLGVGSQLQLLAEYQQERAVARPRGLYVLVSGLLIGHAWKPLAGRVEQVGPQLRYHVALQHDWTLLNWTIFSDTTEVEGLMPLAAS